MAKKFSEQLMDPRITDEVRQQIIATARALDVAVQYPDDPDCAQLLRLLASLIDVVVQISHQQAGVSDEHR